VNPGGGAGWDEPPLDIQIPDDARELDRDVLAYHRELRARRRRSRMRRLVAPFARQGTVMPLLASILAVCLVAGAMLSVATFSPATTHARHSHPPTAAASSSPPVRQSSGAKDSVTARPTGVRSTPGSSAPSTPSARSNPSSGTRVPASSGAP
jgi:cytoskeletal protein RodZ